MSRLAAGTSSTVSIPVELVTDADRVVRTQSYGMTIVLERGGPSPLAAEREGNDRVIDVTEGDRQIVRLRVRDEDADLAWLELDLSDVERIGGRRVPADEIDERGACRDEEPDDEREQQDRASAHSRQLRPPKREVAPRLPSVGHVEEAHPAKLANSDWCAEHEQAGVCEVDLDHAALPWDWTTMSVYSQLSPVPVGW